VAHSTENRLEGGRLREKPPTRPLDKKGWQETLKVGPEDGEISAQGEELGEDRKIIAKLSRCKRKLSHGEPKGVLNVDRTTGAGQGKKSPIFHRMRNGYWVPQVENREFVCVTKGCGALHSRKCEKNNPYSTPRP